MKKILYMLPSYPQISETYMETEIRALDGRFEVQILTADKPDLPYKCHHPYTIVRDMDQAVAAAREAQPDIIHGHYVTKLALIAQVARAIDVPFTVRSHSFDVFGKAADRLADYRDDVNSSLCAGVLGFPPTLALFERAGWDMRKAVSCFPIIEYDWFYDRSPNGPGVMNVGACIRKKRMSDFVQLGARMPEKTFNLYALGYSKGEIEDLNERMGYPIAIVPPVEPRLMPAEYKKHEWMVYTGNPDLPTVGWPLAVAEAQASGVGVCMQRVRPDLEEYLGGAGYLFDTLDEAADIVSRPVPEEIRERGFLQARKSDIHFHIDSLVNLWRAVL
jgi:hypothetical protein